MGGFLHSVYFPDCWGWDKYKRLDFVFRRRRIHDYQNKNRITNRDGNGLLRGVPLRLLPEGSLAYRWFEAADKWCAKHIGGFSGEYTASVECGARSTWGCRILCAVMNLIESDHCAKARRAKGL